MASTPHVAPEAVLTALIEMQTGLITLLVARGIVGLNELQVMAQAVPDNIRASDYDPRFKNEAAEFAKAIYANPPWREWEAAVQKRPVKPS